MAQIGSLIFDLIAKTAGFSKGLRGARQELTAFQKVAQGVGSSLSGVFAGITIAGTLRSAVTQFMEAEKATIRLGFSLKTLGKDAGISLGEVEAFADKWMRLSIFDDDEIKAGAAALTKFTNIKGENFFTTLGRSMDIASESSGNFLAIVEDIGRAVNDPSKAGKLLRPLGISGKFDTQESVLAVLAKFIGQTEQATKSTQGRLQQELNKLGNQLETVGGMAVGFVTMMIDSFQDVDQLLSQGIRGLGKDIEATFGKGLIGRHFEKILAERDKPGKLFQKKLNLHPPLDIGGRRQAQADQFWRARNGGAPDRQLEGILGLAQLQRNLFMPFNIGKQLAGDGGALGRVGGQMEKTFRLMGEGIGKGLVDQGKQMKLSLRTPLEQSNDSISQLKLMRSLGVIDDQTFIRGFAQARSGISAAGKFASAASMGSAEAASAIFRNNDPLKNADIDLAKRQLMELKNQVGLLRDIKDGVNNAVQVLF